MNSASRLPPLADIAATVAGGHVPDAHALVALNRDELDAILAARDVPSFDAAWTRTFSAVEKKWDALEAPADVRARVEEIRQSAFLAVSNVTAQHELASYVSDGLRADRQGRGGGTGGPVPAVALDLYEGGTYPGLSEV